MDRKKTLRNRITALYIAFFMAIAASFVFGTFGSSFSKGFNDGQRIGTELTNNYMNKTPKSMQLYVDLPTVGSEMDMPIEDLDLPEGTEVKARVNKIDVMVVCDSEKSLWSMVMTAAGMPIITVCGWLLIFGYIAVFVLIYLIIASLRRSISSESVFDRKNILRTRILGTIVICIPIIKAIVRYSVVRSVDSILAGSSIALDTSLHIDFWNVIMGIMILFIAEVFAIGYDMTQDQKLTI